jgi:hypothetical protein
MADCIMHCSASYCAVETLSFEQGGKYQRDLEISVVLISSINKGVCEWTGFLQLERVFVHISLYKHLFQKHTGITGIRFVIR